MDRGFDLVQLMSLLTEGLWAIFGRFWNLTVILQTSIHAMSLRRRLLSLRGSPKGRVSLVRDARSSIAAAAQWIAPVDDDPETWSDSELESRDSRSLEWQLLFVVRVDSRLLLTMQT